MKFEDIDPADTRPVLQPAPPLSWLFGGPAERKSWRRYWISDSIQGFANYLTHFALRALPNSWASSTGAWLARLARIRFRNGPFAKRIERNLAWLRPDIAASETRGEEFLRQWWQNHGRVYAEFSIIDRLGQAPHLTLSGLEHLEAARATGRTIILPSVHLATWEIFASLTSSCLNKTFGVFQQQADRFTNRIVEHVRRRTGAIAFSPNLRTTKIIRELLVSGEASLLMFIDEVSNNQIHMPLFGRPAPNHGNVVNILKLAKASNALLVPVYVRRIDGTLFEVVFNTPLEVNHLSNKEGIAVINDFFEPLVLDNLQHWYMLGELRR